MTKTTFNAQLRDTKIKTKNVRKQGMLPANVSRLGKDSFSLSVNFLEFKKLYSHLGDSGLVYLVLEGKDQQIPALVEEVQYAPVSGEPLHVSFKQVSLTEKIRAEVPVIKIGEFDVKEAVLVEVRDAIEVEALPADLPENFEIDISSLTEVGQSITLADLSYDKSKIELVIGDGGMEAPLFIVQELKEEVEEEPVVEAEQEGGEEGVGAGGSTEGDVGGKESANSDKPQA